MWKLETRDGDVWTYDEAEHEEAQRDQYIFGGTIIHVDEA